MGGRVRYPGLDNLGGIRMSKSNEPIWWSLFAAGGVVSAIFIPIFIVMTGLILPSSLTGEEAFAFERIHEAAAHPIVRLLVFCLIVFPLFTFAHRFRSILADVGLMKIRPVISVFCYGFAIFGTIITAVVLWNLS